MASHSMGQRNIERPTLNVQHPMIWKTKQKVESRKSEMLKLGRQTRLRQLPSSLRCAAASRRGKKYNQNEIKSARGSGGPGGIRKRFHRASQTSRAKEERRIVSLGQSCCFVEMIVRPQKFISLAPQRIAGGGTGRAAVQQNHLSPALSPNFVGGEGDQMEMSFPGSIFSINQQSCPRS